MIERIKGDIFVEPEKGLKVIAFPLGSEWRQGGYLTKGISERCPDAEKWHRSQFRWVKDLNKLGDVQWSMASYSLAFCLLICRYSKSGIDFEKLEECFKKLSEGAAALGRFQEKTAIHMPVLKRGMPEYNRLIADYLDDFDVFLYE